MTSGAYPHPRPDRVAAQRNREAAFSRIARVRGASIVGAGALTAAVAGVVSAIAPGHTLGAKARARTAVASRPISPARASSAAKLPPLASPRALGLRSPASAPSSPAPSTPAPTQPSAPTQQSAPAPQSAPTQPSAPVQPSAPTQQSAPAPSQGPVVSGGS